MGTVDPESFDTLHSYANAFEMPFVTPLAPESTYHAPRDHNKQDFAIQIRPGRHITYYRVTTDVIFRCLLHYRVTKVLGDTYIVDLKVRFEL